MLIVILVIVGLSVLILGHEAGHFFAAKKLCIKVDEFGFGFPPRMFAWQPKRRSNDDGILCSASTSAKAAADKQDDAINCDDTVYSVNWLPFGGFVRIFGEKHGHYIEERRISEYSKDPMAKNLPKELLKG